MDEEKKKYVVYGMRAKCSQGTMENYISTDVGHGVVYQGQPLLNANDHVKGVNLTHFGDCNSKKAYEEAKKEIDEKLKAKEGDGLLAKAGKWVAKETMKASVTAKEHLTFHKCELDTPTPWVFINKEHMIDGAPALTVESQCACRLGGIITIAVEENAEENVELEQVDDKVAEYFTTPIDDEILKYGAGAAQLLSDMGNEELGMTPTEKIIKYTKSIGAGNYGDNPSDADKIQEGINAYNERHGK